MVAGVGGSFNLGINGKVYLCKFYVMSRSCYRFECVQQLYGQQAHYNFYSTKLEAYLRRNEDVMRKFLTGQYVIEVD